MSGEKIECNYLDCVAGMGVAGNGQCFLGGDSSNKNCPEFKPDPTDEEIEAMIARDEKREVDRFEVKEIPTPMGIDVWGGFIRRKKGELVFYSDHKRKVTGLEKELEAVKKERDELKTLVVWIEDNIYRHSKVMQKCRETMLKIRSNQNE